MGERKVLNKFYPPDFDPAKIPRRRQPKNQQLKVRMMLPMTLRCNTCGSYIYKGTKFNSRKEDVLGHTYHDIQIFRFYFKCTNCSAEITFKTDPQNSDYAVESGASRNFEPWRGDDEVVDTKKRKREDCKRAMDIVDNLGEMKSLKSRQAGVGVEAMIEALNCTQASKVKKLEEEDEALIRSIVFHTSHKGVGNLNNDRKVQEEGITTANCSRKTNFLDHSKGEAERCVKLKSSVVQISVASKRNPVGKEEHKQPDKKVESWVYQSLCLNYDSSSDLDY